MTDGDSIVLTANEDDEDAYFRRRAAWHKARAEVASEDATRTLHCRFAAMYEQRCRG